MAVPVTDKLEKTIVVAIAGDPAGRENYLNLQRTSVFHQNGTRKTP